MSDLDLCIACRKKVRRRQHGLECDSCNMWQHRTCGTGISVHDYRHAVTNDLQIPFVCKPCEDRTDERADEVEDFIAGYHRDDNIKGDATDDDDINRDDTDHDDINRDDTDHDDIDRDDIDHDDINNGDTDNHDINRDDTYHDDINRDNTDHDDFDRDDTDHDDINSGDTDNDETNQDDTDNDETNQDDTDNDETNQDDTDNDEINQDDTDNDEINRGDTENFNRRNSAGDHTMEFAISFTEPRVIHETSLNDPKIADELIPEAAVQFQVVEGASERGGDLLFDSLGYSYSVKEKRPSCVRWSCTVRGKGYRCPASVSQKGSAFNHNLVEHTHAPDPSKCLTAKITMKTKELASQDVFTSAKTLVSRARQVVAETNPVASINESNIARRANRLRKEMRPSEPKDMNFVIDDSAVPEGFLRDDISVQDRRHVVFATDTQLDTLRRAARWYVDGTFKCMRTPFIMLLTIHAFIKRGNCCKQVPLLYALMTGRKTRDYVAVFESVQNLLGYNRCEGFVMDFERPLWRATRHVFPDIDITGCAFHWGQAVWRHVQQLGLSTQYTSDRGTYAFLRKILCLPFLPNEHIRPTFAAMREFNSSDAIEPLLDYINNTWITSNIWPVESWSVFGQSIRTNNDVEGWHRRLNHRAGVHPPFYTLIKLLHDEASLVEEQLHLVTELSLRRIQRKSYRKMQARLFAAWDSYREGDLSPTALLKKISTIYTHRTTLPEEHDEDN